VAPESHAYTNGRKKTRYWIYAAIIVQAISFLLMAGFGAYAVIQGQRVNKELCRTTDDNRTILKNILDTAEQQSLNSAQDIISRNLIRQGYNELRVLIPPLKCTIAGGPQELEP
jgi:hypothetical protein